MTIKNNKVILIVIVVIYLFLSSVVYGSDSNYQPGSEPNGFRGIKWGTNIAMIKDMQFSNYEGKGKIYFRKSDDLKIGGAQLSKIEYSFYDDRLIAVKITANGNSNCTALIDISIKTFGKGMSKNETWLWMGKVTLMTLKYDKNKETATILMFSSEIMNQESMKQKGF
jgi:hypothetical protein